MKRVPHSLLALLVVILMQPGCSSSVLQLREQLDLHHGDFREKLADGKEFETKFLACIGQAHDESLSERRDTRTPPELLPPHTPLGQAMSIRPLAAVIEMVRRGHFLPIAKLV